MKVKIHYPPRNENEVGYIGITNGMIGVRLENNNQGVFEIEEIEIVDGKLLLKAKEIQNEDGLQGFVKKHLGVQNNKTNVKKGENKND
jgi:hypothetical protein